jgi:endonuclease/exonuclease/phosphatase family metal-dependent hydrolase
MAFTPYVALASLVPLVAAILSRLRWHAVTAAVLTGLLAWCVLPRLLPGDGDPVGARADGPRLRVLAANLYIGAADPSALVRLVRDRRVDVLAVQELTPESAAALDAVGLAVVMPYRASFPTPGSAGSGVFSRYPITDPGVRRLPWCHLQAYATVQVPGAGKVVAESAHPCAPSDDQAARRWAADIAVQPPAAPTGVPRILLGDFNATLDHGGLRDVLATGYRDAAATLGAGLEPTWPYVGGAVHGVPIPPVTLDHVLADPRLGVRGFAVEPIPGSDHHAVLAELALPAAR